MAERLGNAWTGVLADHHRLIRRALAAHGGEEVVSQGDGVFAVFASPRACVDAAIEAQRALLLHAWPTGEMVRARMGIHTGEAAQTTAGLAGLEVHRAARIAAAGYGGQVVVSAAAAELLRDSLPAGVGLKDLGLHRLKDIGQPWQIFQLQAEGLPQPSRRCGRWATRSYRPTCPRRCRASSAGRWSWPRYGRWWAPRGW